MLFCRGGFGREGGFGRKGGFGREGGFRTRTYDFTKQTFAAMGDDGNEICSCL